MHANSTLSYYFLTEWLAAMKLPVDVAKDSSPYKLLLIPITNYICDLRTDPPLMPINFYTYTMGYSCMQVI